MPRTRRPAPSPIAAPLAQWEDDDCSAPALVWWAQLDGRYLVEVVRSGTPEAGALRIFDHTAGDVLVADHPVAVTGDAQFGPVIGDVVAWQRLAIETVDSPSPTAISEQQETTP